MLTAAVAFPAATSRSMLTAARCLLVVRNSAFGRLLLRSGGGPISRGKATGSPAPGPGVGCLGSRTGSNRLGSWCSAPGASILLVLRSSWCFDPPGASIEPGEPNQSKGIAARDRRGVARAATDFRAWLPEPCSIGPPIQAQGPGARDPVSFNDSNDLASAPPGRARRLAAAAPALFRTNNHVKIQTR